jgi:hypothetical protein
MYRNMHCHVPYFSKLVLFASYFFFEFGLETSFFRTLHFLLD